MKGKWGNKRPCQTADYLTAANQWKQLGICGDLITKYMQGVFHNQLATSGDITQGITPYLCLSSIYNMFHMHLSFCLHYHMHKLTWNV